MRLKYSQTQKRIKAAAGIGKPQRTAGGMVKLTSGLMTVVPKIHRKVIKVAAKRPATVHRTHIAVKREQIPLDPCENSNDSGLGFDHHLDYHHPSHSLAAQHSALRFSDKEVVWQAEESQEVKRRRLEIKLESDDANDNFTFPETLRPVPRAICMPVRPRRVLPVTLTSQLSATSHNGLVQLLIACQPETQHRARYQTEGSRGAVKDRSGNGFPVVKLVGYDRPATLQVFIGTDQGRVAPHMFYQACRVSGKNSTPCVEKKIDGTIVIEVDIEPSKEMLVTCDCVGILKERNVDVEHRFPEEGSGRSKKKSTRCRMVFRTTITNPDGSQETLQVTSQPIVCTQPPGVPEICKKSLSSCSVRGGQELFVLGKNFLKDTRVVFQEGDTPNPTWSQSVQPDKEFLQQSHLVCVVPPYHKTNITEPVTVRLVIESSGKTSESHTFMYVPDTMSVTTPVTQPSDNHTVLSQEGAIGNNTVVATGGSAGVFRPSHIAVPPLLLPTESAGPTFINRQNSPRIDENIPVRPVMVWEKHMEMMMPPPPPSPLPITSRRSSVQMIVPDSLSPEDLKVEPTVSLEEQKPMSNVSDLSSTKPPSMDTFHRFVSNNSLPSINVSSYLSNIENKGNYTTNIIKSQLMTEIPQLMIPQSTQDSNPRLNHESSNLLTTVEPILVNQTPSDSFDSRNLPVGPSTSNSLQESVIVNSTVLQKNLPNLHMAEPQNVGMNLLISTTINKQEPTMTEKLDAFVNSAADSHISPTPMTPMPLDPIITDKTTTTSLLGGNDINQNHTTYSTSVQTIGPINLSSSQQQASTIIDPSVCSVLNSPPSQNQSQTNYFSQTVVENQSQLNDQNLSANQTNLICSPQHSRKQAHELAKAQVSLEEHIFSSQPGVSQQMNHDLNLLIQSQSLPTQNQSLPTIQSGLDQVSSQIITANKQLSVSEMNNILTSTAVAVSQVQGMSNFQTTLEQQMSSQTVSSNQSHCGLNNLIHSSASESTTEAQAVKNFQVSLEQHVPSQSLSSPHTECGNEHLKQHRNLTLESVNSSMQTCFETSVNDAQTLSTLQASLEQHLNSQITHGTMAFQSETLEGTKNQPGETTAQTTSSEVFSTFQTSLKNHLSPQLSCHSNHESGSSGLNSLNSSVPTSPQQTNVSQTQVFSNLQDNLQHHLSTQQSVMASLPSTRMSSPETAQDVANQAHALSDIQMSLRHLSPQPLSSCQDLGTVACNTVTSGSPSHAGSQIQVAANQEAQALSNFSSSLGQHLPSEMITSSQPNCLDRHSPLQLSSIEASLQTSNIQASLNHFSSHSLQNSSAEMLPSTDYPSNNSSNNPSLLSSPIPHQTSPLAVSHSEVGMTLQNTVPLSQDSLASLSATPLETSSMILNTSQNMNIITSSAVSSSQLELPMCNSQNNNQFNTIPAVQIPALNQFEQQSSDSDSVRKTTAPFAMTTQTVPIQSQGPTRKGEEGMTSMTNVITQMSENDLISYINPSCFDTV